MGGAVFPPCYFSSVQFSCSVVSNSLQPRESQHARPPCPSPTPRVPSNSRPLSRWCHPAISSSVVPFSSCCQSLPASESFPMSQFFTWGGQSTGASALASVPPKDTQGWSPSEWTGWISLQSKGLSRVFSNIYIFKFYWSIVDLQCCINFCYTAGWFSYTYIFFFTMVYHRLFNIVSCVVQWETPSPFFPLPHWQLQVYSRYLRVCFCFVDMFTCVIF